jgi:glycosyltransferase involved in cell wall biosynthesis
MDPAPRVSVIVPVRNEERYIATCLSGLLAQDYPAERLELLVVDGLSEDRTREIVQGIQRETGGSGPPAAPALRLIDDPKQQRPSALNAGIRAASGEVIVRVDARSVVPRDYVRKCVDTLRETGADNVGGVQEPVADAPMQEAIGMAMSHPFGAGNAQFRVGKRSGFVDTVYLGSFRREIFDTVGMFDEMIPVLSEDSDINQRIRESGGTVYLNTEIRASYYPRETLGDLFGLYFRYGWARAGNLLKHGRLTAWRQLAPPLFLTVVTALGLLAFVEGAFMAAFGAVAGIYIVCDVAVSGWFAVSRSKWRAWPRLVAIFPSIHVAWALGFINRLIDGLDQDLVRPAEAP